MTENVDIKYIGVTYGEDNRLQVLSLWGYKEGRTERFYNVKCSVCAKDSEMFGDGVFVVPSSMILRGSMSCGCSKSTRLTSDQVLLKVKRAVESDGYTFIGAAEDFKSRAMRVRLMCRDCNFCWNTATCENVIQGRFCCPACSRKKIYNEGDASLLSSLKTQSPYPAGSEIMLSGGWGPDRNTYCRVICSVCSQDEFVVAGVCSGIFTQSVASFKHGSKACRCSETYVATPEQTAYKVRKFLSKNELPYRLLDIIDKKFLKLHCPLHNEWVCNVRNLLCKGNRCPNCADYGYKTSKDAAVYVLEVKGNSGGFVGYGISNAVESRILQHRRNLSKANFTIVRQNVFCCDGQTALDVERGLRKRFPANPQEVEGFIREATHLTLYDDVVQTVNKLVADKQTS